MLDLISKPKVLPKGRWLPIVAVIAVLIGAGLVITCQGAELKLSDYPEVFEDDAMIVVGGNASQTELEGAEEIAANLKELTGNEAAIIEDIQFSEEDRANYNLIVVGIHETNSVLLEVYSLTKATQVTEEYPGENRGILEILRNPWNTERALLLVAGSDGWGLKAGLKTMLEMGPRMSDKMLVVDWIEESSEALVEIPLSIRLKALEAYEVIDGRISIPKDLYVASYPPETEGYYIVQFAGPIYEAYKEQVVDLGGELFGYVPQGAFIVKMDETTKEDVRQLDMVNWIGIYQPAYKISPGLLGITGNVTVTITVFTGESTTNISYEIESAGGLAYVFSENRIRVLIDAGKLREIANILGVEYIEKYVEPELASATKIEGGSYK